MKWITPLGLAIACVSFACAAPKAHGADLERSPDVLRAQPAKKIASRAAPLVLAPGLVTTAAGPTIAEVGDPDSFGRAVTYLGLAQTLPVTLSDDCTGSDPATEVCLVNAPAPNPTAFDEPKLATLELPAKATKSLLCFTLTPFINVSWFNGTGAQQTANFSATALISIQNAVLDDPALIDPGTGLPFGGKLEFGLSTWRNSHSIGAGEFENESSTQTRACIAGIVSRRSLMEGYGLTDAQVKEFFKKPMTITFGARGNVRMSQFTSYFYGIRLYGD